MNTKDYSHIFILYKILCISLTSLMRNENMKEPLITFLGGVQRSVLVLILFENTILFKCVVDATENDYF